MSSQWDEVFVVWWWHNHPLVLFLHGMDDGKGRVSGGVDRLTGASEKDGRVKLTVRRREPRQISNV
jgi:hypothetical protein